MLFRISVIYHFVQQVTDRQTACFRRLKVWLKSKSGDDDMKNFPNWDQEFQLEPWPEDGLFDEYLEMGKHPFKNSIDIPHSQIFS